MTGVVVADAGPLIALARAGRLELLRALYTSIAIPPAVHGELRPASDRPGAVVLRAAIEAGWLRVVPPDDDASEALAELRRVLGAGEAEAIVLAQCLECRFLLVDERRARTVARQRSVPIAGIGGVLLAAKENGLVERVAPVLDELARSGYRFSGALVGRLIDLAGE